MFSRSARALVCLLAVALLISCAPPAASPAAPTASPATPTAKPAAPTASPATPTAKPATPTAKPATPTASPATPTAKPAAPTAKPAASGTWVDDAGRTVTLKSTPKKIISLAPSNTEMLYALGLADQVVGVTSYDDYPPEVKNKPQIGSVTEVDSEKIVSIGPDLILATSLHMAKVVPALEKLGLTVYVFDPQTADQVLNGFVTLGQMTGKEKEAQDLKAKLGQRMNEITEKAKSDGKAPRVFLMMGDTGFTAGPGSYVNDLLVRAGAANIAADAKTPWPQLSMEAILKADPEIIVIPGDQASALAAKVKADPQWQQVTAVKGNRFVLIPESNLLYRPGPRVIEGLDALARGLHPDRFKQ